MSKREGIPLIWIQIICFALLLASAHFDLAEQTFKNPLPNWWYFSLVGVIFSETEMGKAISLLVADSYKKVFGKLPDEDKKP